MQFNLLGPLEVVADRALPLGGVVQRATLGYLVLNPNKVVATSRLIEALWGGDAPMTSRKMVQNAISGIRRLLDQAAPDSRGIRLVTAPHGYQLHLDTECVDAFRFRRLAAAGRAELGAGFPEQAVESLAQALGLWRDSVLVDLAEGGIGWPAFAQLERERLTAYEDWAAAGLELGRHRELVVDLEQAAATTPTRERLCHQLMLAHYRCGQQTEALAAYRRTRQALVDIHGLDPTRDLQEMERAILNQEPRLLGRRPQLV
ncbi:AfsR/SARP family transcriptional regulator [Streptomyces phaeolivaceus]|uniref:AfsR/SARP family transcriptional regulator n=1 Tax=Streptomyces phaeolivaceus TaxID=2653200 RepID=A0A5P8K4R2_9ACTN|nr:AfsR/SARP family transcriptional regulator [Streptomyces phaeolivaceus]QFQ97778.1 AfsR/SARP family transcriptional regulator [Streptomyces phaeolivaceus]